jgi:RimJ/RimL family protein N-acetyltransferase
VSQPHAAAGGDDPVLTTQRLVMRRLSRSHLGDLLALYADPEITRFLKPLDRAGHLRRIEEAEQMWATRGHGRVAVHERSTGRFLGRTGLQYWPAHDEVELTWAFRREAWGHGFATEAGLAWLRWGFEHLDLPYITAYIAPENTASRAVANRLDMTVRRTDVQHGREVLVYALSHA